MSASKMLGFFDEAFLKDAIAKAAQSPEARPAQNFQKKLQFKEVEKGKKWTFAVLPEPEQKPEQEDYTHRNRVKYVSPSRRGLVPLTAHVPPQLRQAITEKYEQSGFPSLNEFLTALYQRIIDDPTQLEASTKLAEAVAQTRQLQKTISNLALDLSRPSSQRTR